MSSMDRTLQQVGNYRLVQLLGAGGFAEVYLGEHIHLNTYAAIKLLHTRLDPDDIADFRKEARIVARLLHPHIIRISDFDVERGVPYLVMDYAPDGSLRQRHSRGARLSPNRVRAYLMPLAEALHYAHSQGVIHRDVKPDNMLLGPNGALLLSDFGIALNLLSSQPPVSREVVGTAAYMAPEQLRGKARPASDQYSLAICAYEWLCGTRPFVGNNLEVMFQHTDVPPPPLSQHVPAISPALEEVVLTALAKHPTERYPDVLDFAQAFTRACQSSRRSSAAPVNPVRIQPGNHGVRSQRPPARRPEIQPEAEPAHQPRISRRTMLAGLGVVAVGVGASALWLSSHPSNGNPELIYSPTAGTTPSNATPVAIGTTLLTYREHTDSVLAVAWSPDGSYIASGGKDNTVQIWDSITGKIVKDYKEHSDIVNSIVWSPDSIYIASGSSDFTVHVWHAPDGRDVFIHQQLRIVSSVVWSPVASNIASADLDGDGIQIYSGSDNRTSLSYATNSNSISAIAWSPNGTQIVSGSSGSTGETTQIWDIVNDRKVLGYPGHTRGVYAVSWSPDGKYIASGGFDMTVKIWEASTGNTIFGYSHNASVNAIAWAHDGTHIASASDDHTVQIWDATQYKHRYTYKGHEASVRALTWSLNDTHIASGSDDRTVQVWQAR